MSTIFVVTHLPPSSKLPSGYSYIKVGSSKFEADFDDSAGDSIAHMNANFCELTALYWLWKNHKLDSGSILGLGHYRRLMTNDLFFNILSKKPLPISAAKNFLRDNDLILPRKVPIFSGIYKHYEESHQIEDLQLMLQTLEAIHGLNVKSTLGFLKNQKWAYLFNMIICRKNLLDAYCSWLFPVLFEVHARLNYSHRNSYQARAIGFLAERLFNVWIWQNSNLRIKELPVSRLDKSGFSNLNAYRKDIFSKKPV